MSSISNDTKTRSDQSVNARISRLTQTPHGGIVRVTSTHGAGSWLCQRGGAEVYFDFYPVKGSPPIPEFPPTLQSRQVNGWSLPVLAYWIAEDLVTVERVPMSFGDAFDALEREVLGVSS